MDRIPITHVTRIKFVGYDIPNHLLEAEFSDGSTRQQRKVEQEVYARLMHALTKPICRGAMNHAFAQCCAGCPHPARRSQFQIAKSL